ncbi:retrovirus-related pol polyprotein from transposon TNT 1-94 [Tanacetum coccineum]
MALGYQNPFYLKQSQQKQQSLYNGKVLLEKYDPPAVYDSEETLELAQESRLKMKQLNKEIKPANYTKINHLSRVFVSQTAKSREELYFSNTSKMANVSKSISIPNEEFSDDTTPSVARKFLNESSSAHQEIHKIVKDEILPIVNQVDARVQNFEIQFLKEAAKFVRDFKSLAEEADESLTKHKALELEIKRLLRAVVSHQDIMSIVQNPSVIDSPNLQTELDPYNDMQQKIETLQAPVRKISMVLNYAKENAHLKTTYKNLFDSINVELETRKMNPVSEQKDTNNGTSTNTKFANQSTVRKPSLQPLKNNFVVRQPNAFQSERPKFSKTQVPQKVDETNDLSNPVTSNSVPTPQESKVMKNATVISPRMFRINPFKTSREDKFVPINQAKASVRTNPITVSQPYVITKKHVNSDSNSLSSTGVDNTAKTRRPQHKRNTKNDKVPSASKSSCIKNKEVKVEEHHRNLLLSKNKKHMSSECNKVKLAIRNDKFEVICAMWSPTGRMFDLKGKIIESSESKSQSDCSKGDNACTSNPQEPTTERFPNFTFSLAGTVSFGNDQVAVILGYGDIQLGNISITRVYFVEGLGHKLFSAHATSNHGSWLWHQHLSHLNFDTINDLAKNDIVTGLLKFKYHKEHLCPSCEHGKSKKASHPPKHVPNSKQRLHLLHMDLCGPMRVESINVLLQALVIIVRTDNGTEFMNQVLKEYFDSVGISHQASSVRTPQ